MAVVLSTFLLNHCVIVAFTVPKTTKSRKESGTTISASITQRIYNLGDAMMTSLIAWHVNSLGRNAWTSDVLANHIAAYLTKTPWST